ncbi:unnamed protein product, partial [Prorocentrum cordatum]
VAGPLLRVRAWGGGEFARRAASALLLSDPDNPEHPDAGKGLQARLVFVDLARGARLGPQRWEGGQILHDLAHPDTDRRWLWDLMAVDYAAPFLFECVTA